MMVLVAALLLMTVSLKAQVFIMQEYEDPLRQPADQETLFVLGIGGDADWELPTPIGDGVLVLAAMGGTYLLMKKKKKKH